MCDRLRVSIWSVLIFALAGVRLPGGFAGQVVAAEAGECQGASNPNPADGSIIAPAIWYPGLYMLLDYMPCAEAVSHTGYFSEDRQDVIDRNPAHCLGSPPWPEASETAFVVGYDDPAIPEFARAPLVRGTTYYWGVDTFDGEKNIPGPTWNFTLIDKKAWGPSPEDGELWAPNDGTMTWNLGDLDTTDKIVSYNVYIGTDEHAVTDASIEQNPSVPEYMDNVSTESYEYAGLESETEYFWRVDTKRVMTRPPFTCNLTKGDVWSFTVREPTGSHVSDLNSDGITDFNDYALFANDWPRSESNLTGDINGNNKVNYSDLRILAWNWLLPNGNMNLMIIDGIRYEIETDKHVYSLGEDVELFYRVTNLRETAAVIGELLNCEYGWTSFLVRDNDSTEIWKHLRVIPPCGHKTLLLEPLECKEHRRIWNMMNDNGTLEPTDDFPIGPGIYSVTGELELSSLRGRVPVSVSMEITAPRE